MKNNSSKNNYEMPFLDREEELARLNAWVSASARLAVVHGRRRLGKTRLLRCWLEQAGGDPDLFVQVIHRDEPQRYVREVYRHYDVYARLYGGE